MVKTSAAEGLLGLVACCQAAEEAEIVTGACPKLTFEGASFLHDLL